jgi:hypothetical protein
MGFFRYPAILSASTKATSQNAAAPQPQRIRSSGSEDRKGAMRAPFRQKANRRKYSSPCVVRPRSIWAAPGIKDSATVRNRNGADYSKSTREYKEDSGAVPRMQERGVTAERVPAAA